VVLPAVTPVANPMLLMVATVVADELQVTELVMVCVVLSEYFPVAENCCVAPWRMDGLTGVTEMDTSVGGVTRRVVDPVIEPETARIVALPGATPVARPLVVMVAMAVAVELQMTEFVMFCVLPSL